MCNHTTALTSPLVHKVVVLHRLRRAHTKSSPHGNDKKQMNSGMLPWIEGLVMTVWFEDSENSLLGRLLIDRRVSSGEDLTRSFSGSDREPGRKP